MKTNITLETKENTTQTTKNREQTMIALGIRGSSFMKLQLSLNWSKQGHVNISNKLLFRQLYTTPINGEKQEQMTNCVVGVQLVFFFCSGVSRLFGAQGSPSSGSLLNL